MGKTTTIGWCDHTFNPWWGCAKVSPACKHCYAETLDRRYFKPDPHWGTDAPRRFFGDKHWHQPIAWNRAAEKAGVRRRVFCASMADVFESRDDLVPHRRRLWDLIAWTPWLDWLLLTKRPENFAALLPKHPVRVPDGVQLQWSVAPWPNVWLGVTAEDQEHAEIRIPLLLATPAEVRFLSYEPALGPLDLHRLRVQGEVDGHYSALQEQRDGNLYEAPARLHWVIAGCESGPGARRAEVDWYRRVRDDCAAADVSFLLKQAADIATPDGLSSISWGPGSRSKDKMIEAPYLDGVQHMAWPVDRTGESA